MSKRIFISYRRSDANEISRRIYDALKQDLGPEQLFRDEESIESGSNFITSIETAIFESDVMLVLIGPTWLDVRDPNTGKRRLDDPEDFVRIEVQMGLRHNRIKVIPLLLNGAKMPSADDLPNHMSALPTRNALFVNDETFDADMARLLEATGHQPKRKAWPIGVAVLLLVMALGIVLVAIGAGLNPPQPTTPENTVAAVVPTVTAEWTPTSAATTMPSATATRTPTATPTETTAPTFTPFPVEVYSPPGFDLIMQPNFITRTSADVDLRDFVASATFSVPYEVTESSFDFGYTFRIRSNDELRFFVQAETRDRFNWELIRYRSGEYTQLYTDTRYNPDAEYWTMEGMSNTLSVHVIGETVTALLNDTVIAHLTIPPGTLSGNVVAGTGYLIADVPDFDAAMRVTDFTVEPVTRVEELVSEVGSEQVVHQFAGEDDVLAFDVSLGRGERAHIRAEALLAPVRMNVYDSNNQQVGSYLAERFRDIKIDTILTAPHPTTYSVEIEGSIDSLTTDEFYGDVPGYFRMEYQQVDATRNIAPGASETVTADAPLLYAIRGEGGQEVTGSVRWGEDTYDLDNTLLLFNDAGVTLQEIRRDRDFDVIEFSQSLPSNGLLLMYIDFSREFRGETIQVDVQANE